MLIIKQDNHEHGLKSACFNLQLGEDQGVVLCQFIVQWENNDLINCSNSKIFWFVILCLTLKTHWLQQEHTVMLALHQLAFKYLKHWTRTRSSIFPLKWWMLKPYLSEESWYALILIFHFQEKASDIMRVTKKIITLERKNMNIRFNNQLRA